MQVSLIGLMICAALLGVDRLLGGRLIIALVASAAFGSTSFATISGLGSPLIYIVFELLLVAALIMNKNCVKDIAHALGACPTIWIVLALVLYSASTAVVLPRLFAGMTGAFVPSPDLGLVVEVPLAPTAGNISQGVYFALGGFTFIAMTVLLQRDIKAAKTPRALEFLGGGNAAVPPALIAVGKAFFLWATLNALGGTIDILAKMSGAGDVLEPIRTASYAFLVEVENAGFWRIAGLYPEASAFGTASLTSLAFCFTYWRATGDRSALALSLALLTLVLLSTSSTAYGGLSILGLAALLTVVRSALLGRMRKTDLVLLMFGAFCLTAVLAIIAMKEEAFYQVEALLHATVLDKANSTSGIERAYWNKRSLNSFFTTSMMGIGLGSSRSSNWMIAVLSQLGLIGSLLQGVLVLVILQPCCRRNGRPRSRYVEVDRIIALHDSLRAAAAALLLAVTIGGGAADPGVLFFVALAGVLACRRYVAQTASARAVPRENLLLPIPELEARHA